MEDYKKMYYELFNKVTDVIENLKQIQTEAEETFIASTPNEDISAVSTK